MRSVSFTVYGVARAKGNRRQQVPAISKAGRPYTRPIKDKKAQQFELECARFIPILARPFECDVKVTATIYYPNRLSDLDESLLLDCMQKKVIKNDRQVKQKCITWGLDPERPRAEVTVEPLAGPLFKEQAA